MERLKFGDANSKLRPLEKRIGAKIITFQGPAGKFGRITTCPGAADCLSWVSETTDGKRKLNHGPDQEYACYLAAIAAQYPQTFELQKHNLRLLRAAKTADNIADLFYRSWPKRGEVLRQHVGMDWYNLPYLKGFYAAMAAMPEKRAYFYTKSAHLLADTGDLKPDNVSVTFSLGGKYDHLIPARARTVSVIADPSEASGPIDHDDYHAFTPNTGNPYGGESFHLLIHGNQPKGSKGAAKLTQLRRKGIKTGYSRAS